MTAPVRKGPSPVGGGPAPSSRRGLSNRPLTGKQLDVLRRTSSNEQIGTPSQAPSMSPATGWKRPMGSSGTGPISSRYRSFCESGAIAMLERRPSRRIRKRWSGMLVMTPGKSRSVLA